MIWNWKRCIMHLPVGAFTYWLTKKNQAAGVVFAAGFIVYEISEHKDIHDHVYPDMQGFLWGEAIAYLVDRGKSI